MSVKLMVCYPLSLPAHVMDDVEQEFADKKVDVFLDLNGFPKVKEWLGPYGRTEPLTLLVRSNGEG